MPSRNLLITGASGYIGGTVLKHLLASPSAKELNLFAIVRSEEQFEQVKKMGAVTPLRGDLSDGDAVRAAVVANLISIVVETADAMTFAPAKALMEGLVTVGSATGIVPHFFHTSGAKLLSSHTGVDTDETLSDVGLATYELQKSQTSPFPPMAAVIPVNTQIIDFAEANGIRSYIVVPPMVYGPGEGFGNKMSIQIVALFKILRATGKVFQVDPTVTSWILCHLLDLTSLYLALVSAILSPTPPPSGPLGFYIAENGRFTWNDLSQGIAANLGLDTTIVQAEPADVDKMGRVLGIPGAFVPVSVAGSCNLRGDNGRSIGWTPKFGVDHLLSEAGVGSDTLFMLKELEGKAAL